MITAAQARVISHRTQLKRDVLEFISKKVLDIAKGGQESVYKFYLDELDRNFKSRHLNSKDIGLFFEELGTHLRTHGYRVTVWSNKIVIDWSKE